MAPVRADAAALARAGAAGMLWCACLCLPGAGRAGSTGERGLPLGGDELLGSRLVRGAYWGSPPEEAARHLGGRAEDAQEGVAPVGYLSGGLPRLWKWNGGKGTGKEGGFGHAKVGAGSWLLLHRGEVYGYLQKVPIASWDSYEIPARKRFGAPKKIHLAADVPREASRPRLYLHAYRWSDGVSEFYILKLAPRREIRGPRAGGLPAGAVLRVMQKADDESVPLYVVAVDAKAVGAWRRRGP